MDRQTVQEQLKKQLRYLQKNNQNQTNTIRQTASFGKNNNNDVEILRLQEKLNTESKLPYIQDLETAVLFADISGFTKASETFQNLGVRGSEELSFCMNRYMEGMIKNLTKFGGDIIKFAGDAMIVMWPRQKISDSPGQDDPRDEEDQKVLIIRKAIQGAVDIQKELNNKKIFDNVTLSVKIGIGYGKCAILYVGGVLNRSEFLTVGTALTKALESEGQATAGGQIIVNESAFKYVKNTYYIGEPTEPGGKFYRIVDVKEGVRGRADAILMKTQIKVDRMSSLQNSLRSCVAAAIMPYLEIGFEQYGSETRTLTVMFASLGIELSDSGTKEGRNKIQRVVTTVQQEVYRLTGSLNKLLMDDKGSTLLCVWGVSPYANTDDSLRAIITALNLRKSLAKIEGTQCNIGICTGDVFSGVVGTQGNRKEFSLLGDSTNLAARIMAYPMKYGKKGTVYCCIRTKNEAMNQISFKYGGHVEMKGKSISTAVYEPIDPELEFPSTYLLDSKASGNKIIPPQCLLKLSYNPLFLEKEVNNRKYTRKLMLRDDFVNKILEQIKSYFFNGLINSTNQHQNSQSFLKGQNTLKAGMDYNNSNAEDNQDGVLAQSTCLSISLVGENGSGKTHCARVVCEKLQKDQRFCQIQIAITNQLNQSNKSDSKSQITPHGHLNGISFFQENGGSVRLPIFSSCVNAESRLKFLGGWRPILKSMFEFRRRQIGSTVVELFQVIMRGHYDKIDLILEIFGFQPQATFETSDEYIQQKNRQKQLKKLILNGRKEDTQAKKISEMNPLHFLNKEAYSNQVTDSVLNLCLSFIQDFLGEDFLSESINQDDSSSSRDKEESEVLSDLSGNENNIKPRLQLKKKTNQNNNDSLKQPCVLIFDNCSQIDEESWCLILRIYKNCQSICVLTILELNSKGAALWPLIINKTYKQMSKSIDEDSQYYLLEQKYEKNFTQSTKIFEVPNLNKNELNYMLKQLAQDFRTTFQEDIDLGTEIKDPQHTIKTPEMGQMWQNQLRAKYCFDKYNGPFDQIDDDVLNLIVRKCEGNPLVSLQYFRCLMEGAFIQVNQNGKVVPLENLENCIRLQNFTKIMVPSSVLKNRLKNIDSYIRASRASNPRKGELAIKGIMLIKAAAVIGEEFGTLALKKILPLRHETNSSMMQIIKDLEQQDFIEILDEQDSKNILCRFNKSFLRETIYQVMLFREQKQVLHRLLADHLQSLPTAVMDNENAQKEIDILKQNILIGEDVKGEEELPFQLKQGLIVKQMQNQLLKNNPKSILYRDWVFKEGKSVNKKISKRLLIMTPKNICWYHDDEEYYQGSVPLGEIIIEDIYATSETLLMEGTFDFDICVTKYMKKGVLDNQPRTINFACKTENDRHQWISRIEFLRAITVYENYTNRFVNIQFPLKKIDELEGDDTENKKAQILDQLSQFGKNFKQGTKVNFQAAPSQTSSFAQQNNFGIYRSSIMQSMKLTQLKSNLSRESRRISIRQENDLDLASSSDFNQDMNKRNIISAKDLANKLQVLYTASIGAFRIQVQVHSNKAHFTNLKNKPIGQITDQFKNYLNNQLNTLNQNEMDAKRMSSMQSQMQLSPQKSLGYEKQASIQEINENIEIDYQGKNSQNKQYFEFDDNHQQKQKKEKGIKFQDQDQKYKLNHQRQRETFSLKPQIEVMNEITEQSEPQSSKASVNHMNINKQYSQHPELYSKSKNAVQDLKQDIETVKKRVTQQRLSDKPRLDQVQTLQSEFQIQGKRSHDALKTQKAIKNVSTPRKIISSNDNNSGNSANQVSQQLKMLEQQKQISSQSRIVGNQNDLKNMVQSNLHNRKISNQDIHGNRFDSTGFAQAYGLPPNIDSLSSIIGEEQPEYGGTNNRNASPLLISNLSSHDRLLNQTNILNKIPHSPAIFNEHHFSSQLQFIQNNQNQAYGNDDNWHQAIHQHGETQKQSSKSFEQDTIQREVDRQVNLSLQRFFSNLDRNLETKYLGSPNVVPHNFSQSKFVSTSDDQKAKTERKIRRQSSKVQGK